MDPIVLTIFCVVYAGLILGRLPGLALDRTGVALLGAIALLATGRVTERQAWTAVDLPTMALLFGLMIVSAQFRLGGAYTEVVRRLAALGPSPDRLLAILVLAAGLLSALLANDIVCLAVTPVLIEVASRRKLDPKPFLLGLACAANIGSAATLIGNPQNMLIGQVLHLPFGHYLWLAGVPSLGGLLGVWVVIHVIYHRHWHKTVAPPQAAAARFSAWQTSKGLLVLTILLVCFLATTWPREVVTLVAAGVLLCSRHMRSHRILALVDWQLLLLFLSLFVVNEALGASGAMNQIRAFLAEARIDLADPGWLFGLTVLLSNIISNVPAVMLLLPSATHPLAGPVLAIASTLAGNLLLVGSIANLIVVDQAALQGVRITWRDHALVGVPVTIISLTFAVAWLWSV